ncbi:MAG: VWA domain-containing protein [Chloroflexi bacterium]|nr:MAG: VWA domain-containing protein [Chloroflexota bacterium]MBL1194635.1 VWA domain-containing protein [Chloroflexota bacterium]NOH11925.1 VWA domain-containing protein [Chloroflexota bacterium]
MRKNRLLVSGLLVIALFVSAAFSPVLQDEPPGEETPAGDVNIQITQVDTSQFPEVTVYVSVTDANGEPVGVDANSIVLEENGQAINPTGIGGEGQIGPLTTLLVMDISGSMNTAGKLRAAKDAATAYVEQIRTGDVAGLLSFNTQINYVQEITTDREALFVAIESLRARDDTAMYDALAESVGILENIQGRKTIIVLTDGLDNVSAITPEEVLERIGPSGLSISTIGLGDPTVGSGSLTALDEAALQRLAASAGGAYAFADDPDSLLAVYQRYGRALQSEYAFSYISPGNLRDGVNRALSVSLTDTATSSVSAQGAVYNPGGLVPEIASPAPWPLFLALLGGLLALLLIPIIIGRTAGMVGGGSGGGFSLGRKKSRIKFK